MNEVRSEVDVLKFTRHNKGGFVLLFCFFLIMLQSCDSCPSRIKVESELLLNEVSDPLRNLAVEETIVFINEAREEFTYVLTNFFDGLAETNPDYTAECENGDTFSPYYLRETKSWTYEGADGSEITYSLHAATSAIIRSEDDVALYHNDRLSIEMLFPDCERFFDEEYLTTNEDESLVRYNSPFAVRKHGQEHEDDIISVLNGRWGADIKFALGKGMIAFNYCGRDWVQKLD